MEVKTRGQVAEIALTVNTDEQTPSTWQAGCMSPQGTRGPTCKLHELQDQRRGAEAQRRGGCIVTGRCVAAPAVRD
jgi:hypothetical protein